MNDTEQILYYYNRANEKGRILICANLIILSEGTEEEKAQLDDYINGTSHNDLLNEIYEKYRPIVTSRLAQGALI